MSGRAPDSVVRIYFKQATDQIFDVYRELNSWWDGEMPSTDFIVSTTLVRVNEWRGACRTLVRLDILQSPVLHDGQRPTSISKKMMPRHHQSTDLPCPFRRSTSGAMYSGVPQKLFARPDRPPTCSLHMPKSVSFVWPSLSSSTFSGLRSR